MFPSVHLYVRYTKEGEAAKKTKKGKIKMLLKANLNKTSVHLHIYSSTCLSDYHLDIHLSAECYCHYPTIL